LFPPRRFLTTMSRRSLGFIQALMAGVAELSKFQSSLKNKYSKSIRQEKSLSRSCETQTSSNWVTIWPWRDYQAKHDQPHQTRFTYLLLPRIYEI
jgi:hypothetical protein